MEIERERFGALPEGTPVERFSLYGPLIVRVMSYGATVTELFAPDRAGRPGNVVLGFDRLEPYLSGCPYFGATIGRVANRITDAAFTLDGIEYPLTPNDGPNHLHGGIRGFDKKVWEPEPALSEEGASVRFRLTSPAGDEGYPGRLEASVRLTLTARSELILEYEARSDRATPVNLTHHSYFNLAGAGAGDIGEHRLTLRAGHYLPVDEQRIPTGQVAAVEGSPYDFRTGRSMGERRGDLALGGYDHNFVLDPASAPDRPGLRRAAEVVEPQSGRALHVATSEPGMQFYDGNMLDGTIEGMGGAYSRFGGFTLEAQGFPDAVHQPRFPSVVLRPGEVYRQRTVYRFFVLEDEAR